MESTLSIYRKGLCSFYLVLKFDLEDFVCRKKCCDYFGPEGVQTECPFLHYFHALFVTTSSLLNQEVDILLFYRSISLSRTCPKKKRRPFKKQHIFYAITLFLPTGCLISTHLLLLQFQQGIWFICLFSNFLPSSYTHRKNHCHTSVSPHHHFHPSTYMPSLSIFS